MRGQKTPVPPMAGAAGPGELHRQWQSRGFNEQAHNLLRAKCWEHGFGIERKNYQRARVRAQEAHLLILITHWPISISVYVYIYILYIMYINIYTQLPILQLLVPYLTKYWYCGGGVGRGVDSPPMGKACEKLARVMKIHATY